MRSARGGVQRGEKWDAIIYRAYAEGGYTKREIGEYPGPHYSSVSLAIKRFENRKQPI